MKSGIINGLIYTALFIVVTVSAFKQSALLGFAFLLTCLIVLLIIKRATVFQMIGRAEYGKGSLQKALAWYKRAYKTGSAKPQTIVSYAYLHLKTGNIEEADNILEALSRRNLIKQDRLVLSSNYALIEWKKGNLDKAIEILEDVIKEYETSNIYGSLGYMYIQKGDIDKAYDFNLKAFDYNSSNSIIRDNLGQVLYLKGNYDRAVEIYEPLMETNPTFPDAYYNYALVLREKGEPEKALEKAKAAKKYDLSFLSTITKDDLDSLIDSLESETGSKGILSEGN